MEPNRPHAITAASGRTFATFPAAVVVPIVNGREELLLLESQRRPGLWEPVNGAVEDDETLLEAALREVREEAVPICGYVRWVSFMLRPSRTTFACRT